MDAQVQTPGFVVWVTGMDAAGKSTLAAKLHEKLAAAGRRSELLDEGDLGDLLFRGLGASQDDRGLAARRVGLLAKLVARHGGVAVCASLSPQREVRDQLRRELRRFVEVFVDCPMERLLERDHSGTYRKALAGELKNVAGIDDPYEPPARPEVTVHSDQEPVEAEAQRVFQACVDLKLIAPAEFGRLTGGQRPRRARAVRSERSAGRRKLARKGAAARNKAPRKVARAAKARRSSRR
jgi:adenylylsulfate kinase